MNDSKSGLSFWAYIEPEIKETYYSLAVMCINQTIEVSLSSSVYIDTTLNMSKRERFVIL